MAANILEGPKDLWGVPHQPVGKLLKEFLSSHHNNKLAVIDIKSGQYYTYGDLLDLSQNLASNLRQLSVEKDNVIGIISENSYKIVVVYLAALYLAAPLHFINPKYTQYELQHILLLSRPKLIFCSKKALDNLKKIKDDLDFLQVIVVLDEDEDGGLSYSNLVKKSEKLFQMEKDIDVNTQTAIILNSSGTTGLPKGVMVTHENLRTHFVFFKASMFYMKSDDFVPVVIPIFHIYGFTIVNITLCAGATILAIDQFDPKVFLETIQRYRVERLFVVPTIINFLLNSPLVDQYDLSSLTEINSGGSVSKKEDYKALKTKFKLEKTLEGYGLTETGITIMSPRDEEHPVESCGKLTPGYRLKIVQINTDKTLGPLQIGEMCFGGCIMKGYVNNKSKTDEIIDFEGFVHTGDLGYYDEAGFIYIKGRLKDVIKYKSLQVSPEELENILVAHPSIKEVAVVGKGDQRYGEVAVGFVVKEKGAKLDEEEVLQYLKEKVCEEKWLHGGVRFVDGIPRNAMGKILRNKLQEMLEQ